MKKNSDRPSGLMLLVPLMALSIPTAGCLAQATAKIQVVSASYGYAGNRKDVKDDLTALCDQKPTCSFTVKNETFGLHLPVDPSPGDDKSIIFSWTCGDAAHKDSAAEKRTGTLSCK